jgi:hypothetical protein
MGEVIADGWVEETVEAVDFAAPHDFGERQGAKLCPNGLSVAARYANSKSALHRISNWKKVLSGL